MVRKITDDDRRALSQDILLSIPAYLHKSIFKAFAAHREAAIASERAAKERAAVVKPQGGVYIASRFSRRSEAYRIALALQAAGFTISCRWVMQHEDHIMPEGLSRQAEDAERERYAREDVEDMNAASWCVSLMDEPRGNGRGGRHVEFGYMLAKGARLTIIGPRETVFHHLPAVEYFDTAEAFLAAIERGEHSDQAGKGEK